MGTGGRVCGALSRVAAIVTSFTVAHSITLALAALHVVQLPARLTESAIALSVIAAALNNLFQVLRGRPWALQRCDPVSGGSSRCSCHPALAGRRAGHLPDIEPVRAQSRAAPSGAQ
jgi:hypothetical protein